MLLSITTTHRPATDLGFVLHKNPANVRTVDLSFGAAHVFYPEASEDRCTATLMLEIDSVGLVRRRNDSFALAHYVNDRAYVASSFVSVALAKLFGTAMKGHSNDRPDLAAASLPLEVHVPVLPCRGGEPVLRALFEPLGYAVAATPVPDSHYADATFTTTARVADVLTHLYVLLPVLDDEKHYWVGDDEVDKLLARGGDWLASHPERDLIVRRYLRHQRHLADAAFDRLTAEEPAAEPDDDEDIGLNTRRIEAVVGVLKDAGARRVIDLGCGEGRLLQALLGDPQFTALAGTDVSYRALKAASRNLQLDRRPEAHVELFQSSLTYRDRRIQGYDAACLLEVIEHVDLPRLPVLVRNVFGEAEPATVVVTTPNVEHNVRLGDRPLRHRDHRFEWTRAEFAAWASAVAEEHGYTVRLVPVGPDDPEVGPPTQMAVFHR